MSKEAHTQLLVCRFATQSPESHFHLGNASLGLFARRVFSFGASMLSFGNLLPLVVGSHGSVLGVWVPPADVSDARGARGVLEQVLRRYPSAQIVIADGAYDKEGLLE